MHSVLPASKQKPYGKTKKKGTMNIWTGICRTSPTPGKKSPGIPRRVPCSTTASQVSTKFSIGRIRGRRPNVPSWIFQNLKLHTSSLLRPTHANTNTRFFPPRSAQLLLGHEGLLKMVRAVGERVHLLRKVRFLTAGPLMVKPDDRG